MTLLYPIVLEIEDNGVVSAYVPGLPVYAAAETPCKGGTRHSMGLDGVPGRAPGQSAGARVRVARFSDGKSEGGYRGVAALVGARRSATKARASRTTAGSAVALAPPPHENAQDLAERTGTKREFTLRRPRHGGPPCSSERSHSP